MSTFKNILKKADSQSSVGDLCQDGADGKLTNAAICEDLIDHVESNEFTADSRQRAIASGLYSPEDIKYFWG